MKTRHLISLGGCFFVLISCAEKKQPQAPPPPLVTVAQPLKQKITEWNEYTGRLDSAEDVEVRSRVSGYLQSVHFAEGQQVKEGDLLFTIDQRPFLAEENRAKASVAQAQAAQNLAQANLKRVQKLIEENAISRQDFDLRKSEAEQANANVQAAEANLETARLNLGFTKVRSPINGIAGESLVTKGNLISGGNALSTLLTTVVPHIPIYVYFELDESSTLAGIRRYFAGKSSGRGEARPPVEMQLADEEGFPHKGFIDFVDNRLDRDTATMMVRGRFENKNRLLTPGLFARVRVQAGDPYEAILIPDSSIGTLQSQKYVWIVDQENRAEQRNIKIGPLHEGLRIIRSGLDGSERLVIKGIQMLRPGSPLTITESQIAFPSASLEQKDNE